jgi:hypothetical protein
MTSYTKGHDGKEVSFAKSQRKVLSGEGLQEWGGKVTFSQHQVQDRRWF